ncbi:hypothetical protein CU098_009340 [Rhizopus stolonifer]|uniref:Uncharacterized protein n=1 Tax=Rhizopus stolonifer TaxID=4846 RepID=A0A367K5N5_RHIST|nr:hypothetical protein CU098_009340 [Rhizopus stolonifer]
MANDKTSNHKANKPRGRSACQNPNKADKAGRTKIFAFTSSGHLDKVKELIKRGADVNHRDNAGWAPLHEAALKGQYDIARYLIQSGAIVNVRGFENDTPLHDACSYGYSDCVKLLLESGADVYALNTDKKRPIDLCEDKICIEIVKARMNQLDSLAKRDNQGKTVLHRACIEGSIQEINRLLKDGLDSNATDRSHWTPLHYAAQYGHLETVKALVQYGADINSIDNQGQSVLHVACQHGHEQVVQYLVDTGVDVHCIDQHEQTPYQVTESVAIRQILTARIDQERKLRATTEAIDEVTFVSNTKQKRNTQDNQLSREERKIQAIMRAFEKAEKKQKKPVNTNKLDPHKKDTSGRTHLFRWSIRGDVQVVKALLDAGANPSETDNAGYSPLHEAALRGKAEVVRLLLENDADVNCRGADMDTPLHDAAENGYPEIVQLLLDYGADITVKNAKGQTPLDIALQEENDEIERLLKDHKDTKPKKRKADLQPESPTSPTGVFDMKAHARQLSGQHLPKKSFKPLIKTEVPPDGPHTPIPTPPPEGWHRVKKEDDDYNEDLYPSLHCASRYLPLYTIQLVDDNHFFVVDLQVSLLLGITIHQFVKQYPHLHRRQVSNQEKERLWSPLSSMICVRHEYAFKESEKQKFLEADISFVRLDQ